MYRPDISKIPLHLRSDLHLMRKLWHAGIGVLGLMAYHRLDFSAENTALGILTFGFFALIVEIIRLRVESLNRLVIGLLRPFLRESERTSISGLPYYAFGAGLSLFFFNEKIAVLSIMFLVFADPIASIFGVLYGKDKIFANKTLQGVAAGFTTCYLLTLGYSLTFHAPGWDLVAFSLLAALIGAFSETISGKKFDDNLTIPLISGVGLSVLNVFFNIL